MTAYILHYVKKANGRDTEYDENRRPVTRWKEVQLPLRFGYGSYNEPAKVFGTGIDVANVIEISHIKPEEV